MFFDYAQLLQKVTELWNEVMIGNRPEVCKKVIAVILQASADTFQATAVADLEAARCN